MLGDLSTLKGTAVWVPLILRLVIGVIFIAHGSQKIFGAFGGPGINGFAAGIGQMGLHPPLLWAWLAALAEFVGGIAILFGFLTGIASIALIINMIVAIALVHGKHGFFGTEGGFEYNLALITMLVALILSGPGALSVDRRIGWPF
jgi:putative oxidoreductase